MARAPAGLPLVLALALGASAARGAEVAEVETVPEKPQQLTTTERSWSDDWSLLPVLFYSPETELGFGAAVIRSLELPEGNPSVSTIALGVIYTTRGQFISRLEPDLRFGDTAYVHSVIRFQRYPTRFFRPGAHLGDEGEPYDEQSLIGHVDGRLTVTGRLRAGLRWEFRYNDLSDYVEGGVLDSSGVPGLGSYFASGLGPVISYDSRDEPRLPRRGLLVDLRAIAFAGYTGSDFEGLRVDLDVRGYLDLGNCHVLAAQLRAQTTQGDVPFQLLPQLGGAAFLRGWYEGHVRDRHALLAQLEWRFPLVARVSGAAFGAVGEAVRGWGDVSAERVRAAGGLGFRYLLNQRQNVTIRLDLAWGSGLGVYFDVLEAF